jgi:hypothetical protein
VRTVPLPDRQIQCSVRLRLTFYCPDYQAKRKNREMYFQQYTIQTCLNYFLYTSIDSCSGLFYRKGMGLNGKEKKGKKTKQTTIDDRSCKVSFAEQALVQGRNGNFEHPYKFMRRCSCIHHTQPARLEHIQNGLIVKHRTAVYLRQPQYEGERCRSGKSISNGRASALNRNDLSPPR